MAASLLIGTLMNLNEYIIQNAGLEIDGGFIRRFSESEIFFALDVMTKQDSQIGSDVSIGLPLAMQTANFNFGKMGLFYATVEDSRLGSQFVGIPLIKAARMVCDSVDVDGILVQSSVDAWVAVQKKELREVIGQVRDRVFYKDFSKPPEL